jgi:hypothetical protein
MYGRNGWRFINPVCARASLADGQETKTAATEAEYIDELPDYTNISSKKLVAIDPNMSDLLYCVMIRVDKTIYRYTQDASQGHVRETSQLPSDGKAQGW